MTHPFDDLIADLRTQTNQTESEILRESDEILRAILDTAGSELVDREIQKP